jgi:hypothetical protein
VVTRTCLNVTFISTLPDSFIVQEFKIQDKKDTRSAKINTNGQPRMDRNYSTLRYVAQWPTSVCRTQTNTKSLCSYKVFVRIGDVDVSWDSFLRPLSTSLWVVMAACTVIVALALRICFQIDSGQTVDLRTDTRLQDVVFATFGAVFCLQGKPHANFTCFNPLEGTGTIMYHFKSHQNWPFYE